MAPKFEEINCHLLGASVDSPYSHLQWMKNDRRDGGLGGALKFPLISDLDRNLMADYGASNKDGSHSVRATFVIDKKGIVRHISLNDPPIGRSVKEIYRIVKAIQVFIFG